MTPQLIPSGAATSAKKIMAFATPAVAAAAATKPACICTWRLASPQLQPQPRRLHHATAASATTMVTGGRRVSPSMHGASLSWRRGLAATATTAPPTPLFREYVEALRQHVKEITVEDLAAAVTRHTEAKHGTLYVFDVREPIEWNREGHIPTAIHTGRGFLERDVEALVAHPHDDIVVYCAGGARSVLAADALQRMGFSSVRTLAGGFGAWRSAGKQVDALPNGGSRATTSRR
ncbi:hypothetical protein HK405_008708 [Cladochytrium tenue]|nr:hypothetical protein HK405_008708 [Cladochytrium tenue]